MNNQVTQYTLRSKDIPLVSFDYIKSDDVMNSRRLHSYTIKITRVYRSSSHLFPKELGAEFAQNTNEQETALYNWLSSRKTPRDRIFIDKLIAAIGDPEDPLRYIQLTKGLSLNDAFWITDDNRNDKWRDNNLYTNPLNEITAQIAFTGIAYDLSGVNITTPEFTSRGALRKCWINTDDGVCLMKGDEPEFCRKDGRSQATMEFYAAQVAEVMGLEHINYSLKEYTHSNGRIETVCICPLFTSEDEGYVAADVFFKSSGLSLTHSSLLQPQTHVKMAEIFGWDTYADMMVFDALIMNSDRHLGNFGYIIDNNTGQFIRPAPIFDNGMSLLNGAAQIELDDPQAFLESESGQLSKYLTYDLQTKLFVDERHIPFLEELTNFKFKQPSDKSLGISDSTLDVMSFAVRYRAKRAIELFNEIKGNTLHSPGFLEL